jgi:hypothetical protein
MSDIDSLADYQERTNTVNYYPNSSEIVRDLIHPGLYSYVKDVSPIRAWVKDVSRGDSRLSTPRGDPRNLESR